MGHSVGRQAARVWRVTLYAYLHLLPGLGGPSLRAPAGRPPGAGLGQFCEVGHCNRNVTRYKIELDTAKSLDTPEPELLCGRKGRKGAGSRVSSSAGP